MDVKANNLFSPEDKLWEMEPNSDIFVDIHQTSRSLLTDENSLRIRKHRFFNQLIEPVKSDKVSTDFRVAGNQKFKEHKWRAAMELYNQSLRFAEKGSENVSFAYANRSSCFLHMGKYTQCLNDIEMARETGYPKRLMHKLDEREMHCLEKIKERDEIEDQPGPKLSFDPDEKFPCMANVLELKRNEEYGRHFVAKCDIDVGQTVVVDEPFASVYNAFDRSLCFTCALPMKNFIPCDNCTDAMFCGEACMNTNKVHQISCGSMLNRVPGFNFVAKSILVALNAFNTEDELMKFVEKQMTTSQLELENEYNEMQTQYAMFLHLNSKRMQKGLSIENRLSQHTIYTHLMAIPMVKIRFDSLRKQRFLMHLIWKHSDILQINKYHYGLDDGSGTQFCYMELLGNIQSLFNHSCIPNVTLHLYGTKQIFTTIAPVKKGQQLFVVYNKDIMMKSTEERQDFLRKYFNFTCKCRRCDPEFQPINSLIILLDPAFKLILEMEKRATSLTSSERLFLRQKCFEFMRKFGHNSTSKEVHFVIVALLNCFDRDYVDLIK